MADPPDYSFMRSGLSGGERDVIDLKPRLMRVVSFFMECVIVTAAKYADHAGRRGVTPEDVRLAMQHESRVFFERPDLETAQPRIDMTEMFGTADTTADADDADADDADADDATDDEDDTDDTDDVETEPWTRSACACELCAAVHRHSETWDAWEPEDPVLQFLKRHTSLVL